MSEKFYLGLDSGGTKTQVALLAADGAVIAQQMTGPVRLTARRASAAVITRTKEIIDFTLQQANIGWGDIAFFGFGMCGADYDDEIPTQERTLGEGLGIRAERMKLVNDGIVALWGGSAKKRAVILQLGTAFTAAYRTDLGRETPFDHLNAGVIVELRRTILASGARVLDGRLPRSILPELLLKHFEEQSPEDVLRKYVRNTLDSWKLLTVITPWREAVEQGDKVALKILEGAAKVYADDIKYMLKKMDGDGADVVLGGGLLANAPRLFRQRIAQLVRKKYAKVTVHSPHLSPAVGGAVMAAYLDGVKHRPFYRTAKKTWTGASQ